MATIRPYVKASADMTITVNTRHPLYWFDYIRTQLAYWIAPAFVLKDLED